jgi:hypothetical protein
LELAETKATAPPRLGQVIEIVVAYTPIVPVFEKTTL